MTSKALYGKQVVFLAFFLFINACTNRSQAQQLKPELCEKFLQANELYLLNSAMNDQKLTTGKGQSFTFEQLVRNNWPEKKIIPIDEKEYNKLEGVQKKFHIAISSFRVKEKNVLIAEIYGILIQKGKTGRDVNNTVYWININIEGIMKGVLTERLIYAVENIKNIVRNYKDKSIREKYFYKVQDYKETLQRDTLYLVENQLWMKPEKVSSFYPYPFKVVKEEERAKAITEKREKVLFIEIINGGYYTGIDVYHTKEGRLIISSFPWIQYGSLTRTFFKKMVK